MSVSGSKKYDVVIIGGGIIGLATAYKILLKSPHKSLALVEKERSLGEHQTGRNSGVIHSGIYYKPGSLKAKNCVSGAEELKNFCTENGIEVDRCGKVIVATGEEEVPRLLELERRGLLNGVRALRMISKEELAEIEPYARGVKALHSPTTSIVDYREVLKVLREKIEERGGEIFLGSPVRDICENPRELLIKTPCHELRSVNLINCAGVYADRVAEMGLGEKLPYKIFPFRGEYYTLTESAREKVKGLIYPVPDPSFPFLGVHLTKMVGGSVEAGPNAVLAFSKVGYSKSDINLRDCTSFFTYKGFWKLAANYWRTGAGELYRSFSKRAFLKALQKLLPDLTMDDLEVGGAGIRAQLLLPTGLLHDDFRIERNKRMIHVLNAPSPGATASFAIGDSIADLFLEL